MKEHIENIKQFADKWGIDFIEHGSCGFGRRCVGLSKYGNYVDYNPMSHPDYEQIPELFSELLYDAVPEDAYHKHNCMAVLGEGPGAIEQLSKWVDALNGFGVEVVEYNTGATGIQAMITGPTGTAVRVT